jgi:iron complex outermembrane receptor protein
MRYIFTFLILFGIGLPTARAAEIVGTVTNDRHEPLPNVSVVTNLPGVGTLTGADGGFALTRNREIARLTFSSVGYNSRQLSIASLPDTIVLEARFYPGSDITVTADRARPGISPIAFENVSADDLARDFTVGDLPVMLNTTPNFYSFSDAGGSMGYTYTQIRGFDDKRVATYIDGVPMNDPEDQYNYWVDLPDFTENVTDVQIQRGVGNSLYGDASFGGTINVVTNTLELPRQASVTAGYGEYYADNENVGGIYKQSLQYASGLIDGRWAFSGRYSKAKTDGYRREAWVDSWAYYLSIARLDPNMTTELQVFGGPMSLRLTYYGIPGSTLESDRRFNPFTYDGQTDNFNQPHVHLHNTYTLSRTATLYNTLYFIRGKGWYEEQALGALYSDYNIDTSVTGGTANGDLIRVQSVEKFQVGWNPRLELKHSRGVHSFGGSFYYFESDHFGQVTWAQNISGALDTRHKYYQHYGTKKVGSLFAQEYYRLTDRLSVQATGQMRFQSYRFEQEKLGAFAGYDYDLTWLFFSPRLGLNYRLPLADESHSANIYANFAIASSTPTDNAIYNASDPYAFPSIEIQSVSLSSSGDSVYTFGDPTFRSERVYNVEFGGNYRTPTWNLGANVYWMDFADEIIAYGGINPSNYQPATTNADGSYRLGLELSGAVRPAEAFTLSGNLSLNRYRIKDFSRTYEVYDDNFDVIGDTTVTFKDVKGLLFPDILANAILDYKHDNLRLTYRFRVAGKQYMEVLNLDSLAIDAYTISSVQASFTLPNFLRFGDLTVTGTIDNLFNKKYVVSGYGWNYAYSPGPGQPVSLFGEAEYYVAAERSVYGEIKLTMF